MGNPSTLFRKEGGTRSVTGVLLLTGSSAPTGCVVKIVATGGQGRPPLQRLIPLRCKFATLRANTVRPYGRYPYCTNRKNMVYCNLLNHNGVTVMAQTDLNLKNLRLAVLIDAENVPRNCLKSVMEEIAIYGTPTIKRIYGDWTTPTVSGWKGSLLENAITPVQQYSYTTGKNSSDSAMIIDAMDILYTEKTDGFVIVSSDSDFTRLAIRLREAGQRVIGIGERKTPSAFIAACDKFTYIEVIRDKAADARDTKLEFSDDYKQNASAREKPHSVSASRTRTAKTIPPAMIQLIADSVFDLADDSGAVFMGELGNLILKKQPDFDHRNFGFNSLSALIKTLDRFEIDFRQTTDPNIKHVFVRDKEAT